jgi:lyso-ornithine lipid O-acyltransferase
MSRLRAVVLLFIFTVMVLGAFVWQGISVGCKCRRRKTFPRRFHTAWCKLFGIRVIVVGKPVAGQGVLLVANHMSYLDIPVIGSTTRQCFVSRHDVARWPIVGLMVRLQESVLVERKKRGKAGEQLDDIRQRLTDGDRIVIFAEGTTSDGNRILPFKSSLIGAAVGENGLDFPIQPVSISYVGMHGMPIGRENRQFYTWSGDSTLLPHIWEMLKAGPLDAVVEFHPPLSATVNSRKDAAQLAETAVRQGCARAAQHLRDAA